MVTYRRVTQKSLESSQGHPCRKCQAGGARGASAVSPRWRRVALEVERARAASRSRRTSRLARLRLRLSLCPSRRRRPAPPGRAVGSAGARRLPSSVLCWLYIRYRVGAESLLILLRRCDTHRAYTDGARGTLTLRMCVRERRGMRRGGGRGPEERDRDPPRHHARAVSGVSCVLVYSASVHR